MVPILTERRLDYMFCTSDLALGSMKSRWWTPDRAVEIVIPRYFVNVVWERAGSQYWTPWMSVSIVGVLESKDVLIAFGVLLKLVGVVHVL
jgi:hypothetical protein